MKRQKLRFDPGFRVGIGNRRAQVATMTIKPGDAEGDPSNRHRGSDQWLYVLEGSCTSTINDRKYRMTAGSVVLIERGDRHEIRNTGRVLLRTLNFYVPPAYSKNGEPLSRGRK